MTKEASLLFYYRQLRQHGLNDSHSGNASVRLGNGEFAVTQTGACADTIETNNLIICDINGALAENSSLDAGIHQYAYQKLSDCNALLHAHNPYTTALTLKSDTFNPVDFEGKLYFGELDIIECEQDNYLSVMPQRIIECLKHQPIAIVRSHGVYAAADSLMLAYKWLCSIEQSAKIAWLAKQI